MTQLTSEQLKQVLTYDPVTGVFIRNSTNNVAGKNRKRGYIEIEVHKKWYRAHRLAWLYVYGEWPVQDIDHADRNKENNAISNLRYLTPSQQCQNTNMSPLNTSGYRGVHLDNNSGKWRARIRVNNVKYNLGSYDTPEEAYQAYLGAAAICHTHNPCVNT